MSSQGSPSGSGVLRSSPSGSSSKGGNKGGANNNGAVRKRVCKACDRCRMKKSKCDGKNPCVRCESENIHCKYGDRKRLTDRALPRGYVDLLEEQQHEMIEGLKLLYRIAVADNCWPGPRLREPDGIPLTHDILETLGALNPSRQEEKYEPHFIENLPEFEQRLNAQDAEARKAAGRETEMREATAREIVLREAAAREAAMREVAAREAAMMDAAAMEATAREAAALEAATLEAAAAEEELAFSDFFLEALSPGQFEYQ